MTFIRVDRRTRIMRRLKLCVRTTADRNFSFYSRCEFQFSSKFAVFEPIQHNILNAIILRVIKLEKLIRFYTANMYTDRSITRVKYVFFFSFLILVCAFETPRRPAENVYPAKCDLRLSKIETK